MHLCRITKPFTLLTIGILVAQAVSGPVAAGFLAMNGLGGLKGWQWLFLLEGLPTVLMSAVVWCCLPDSPGSAKWLNDGERKLLEADVSGLWYKLFPDRESSSARFAAVYDIHSRWQIVQTTCFTKLLHSRQPRTQPWTCADSHPPLFCCCCFCSWHSQPTRLCSILTASLPPARRTNRASTAAKDSI